MGCATQVLDEELPKYSGRHVDALISMLGLPDGEQMVAGRRIIVWHNSRSGSYSVPQYNTGTANTYGYGGSSTTNYSYTTYRNQSYNYTCTIKAVLNEKNIVQYLEYEGNQGGCLAFSRRLR